MQVQGPTFNFAVTLGAGVAAQLVARHLRVPSIVLLLATGVALGPDGLGWIAPRSLGEGLFALVSLGVAVILFEGALGLDRARLRAAALPVRRLVTVGAVLTMAGAAAAAALVLDWPLERALLFGSLVVVTGPTVVRPILRAVPVSPRLAAVLEAEGLLIDSIGALLAAVTVEIVAAQGGDRFASGASGLAARVVFGVVAGVVLGGALSTLVRRRWLVPEGLENLVALGGALTGFALSEATLPDSGILAVTIAGAVVGNRASEVTRQLSEFQEHLTVALIGMLFVLLAADVRIADIAALGARGWITVAVLAFVVRPACVAICTRGSDLSPREKAYLAWLGPRGVVAAAVASLAATVLEEAGIPGGREVRALVFLTIAATVVVLGGGAPLVARLLGVSARGRDSIVILGAGELGRTLAGVLREGVERIVLADNNPDHCRAAEAAGFGVVFGDAAEDLVLARMQLERARAAIGLTTRTGLNHLFVARAREDYGVRELYVAAPRGGDQVSERLAERAEALVLFDRPKEIDRWNVRLRHGSALLERLRYAGERPSAAAAAGGAPAEPDAYLFLAVRRGARWEPMHTHWQPRPGDEAVAILFLPQRDTALAELRSRGWELEAPAPGGGAAVA